MDGGAGNQAGSPSGSGMGLGLDLDMGMNEESQTQEDSQGLFFSFFLPPLSLFCLQYNLSRVS